jgi:acyl-coenzyme A synthetase/AMP-(fatty) acid ligase
MAQDEADAASAYARFLSRAAERGGLDLYAAFEPFNEATRALYPLIGALRAHLRPGDIVLDLRCRSGWTGALLAGLFPEQRVISFWEGPSNTLGYAGYAHWLSAADRPPNWTVAFADPRKGLPLPTGTAGLVFGADCLHRVSHQPFLEECLRVCRLDGALVFPHVHLANGKPSPYFERGGTILHGTAYRDWLYRVLAGSNRQAYVLSEPALFCSAAERVLRDEADTADYNGLIAVLKKDSAQVLGPARRAWRDDDYLMANPLLRIDSDRLMVSFDPIALAGEAGRLIDRHPTYARRLEERLPADLADADVRILYWAQFGLPLAAIRQRTGLPAESFAAAIDGLERREAALPAPIGPGMARLQNFLVTRDAPTPLDRQHFATLWDRAPELYGNRPVLVAEDGSVFGFDDVEAIVAAMAAALRQKGVRPGAPLALIGPFEAEAIFAVWAAWLIGAAVAPIDAATPAARIAEMIVGSEAALVLCHPGAALPDGMPAIVFGPPGAAAQSLSEAMAPHLAAARIPAEACREEADAAILFTSGSTGAPKGLVLSHGGLFRGAGQLAKVTGWGPADVLLSLGGLHAMSGLRNPCVAALAAGTTIVVPAHNQTQHPAAIAETCRTSGVTVISTVPAFLNLASEASRHGRLHFGALRQVAVTGSTLPVRLQHEFETTTGIPVLSYYGLTETAGICLAVPAGCARGGDGDIGVPTGALVRIADEVGRRMVPGDVGELQIFSANIARRLDGSAMPLADGWFRTGDLARWDARGHIVLSGRLDRQVKNRQGEIVQPEAIETELLRHPDIADATVVPDDRYGVPRLTGFIVPVSANGDDAWLQSLEAWIGSVIGNQRGLDRLVALDRIPRNANGKISPDQLRSFLRE